MADHFSCPHCNRTIPRSGSDSPPPNCPGCGARITCQRCGSTLKPGETPTSDSYCLQCRAQVPDSDTELFEPSPRPPAEHTLQLPGFEVRGELGRGGMGIVYRARQLSLQREVAIKVLPPPLAANPHLLDRFRNEAAVAAGLVDSHILPVFDVQEIQGVPVIIMPLVEGSDLGRIIADRAQVKRGRPPATPHQWALLDDREYLGRILPLLDQIIATVAALHKAGVLHRDLKPSNVLVDERGNHWLSDFGLARLEEQGAGTRTGAGLGTPGYMSPEQAGGEEELDERADLFSLGVSLYQTLTLELPYGKRVGTVRPREPARPSRRQPLLSKDFDAVILKTLEWDREQRYRTAGALQEDWQRVRQGLLPKAQLAGTVRLAARWTRRHAGTILAVTAIALLAVALVAALWPNDLVVYRTVRLQTDPKDARVALVPIDPETGEYLADKALRPRERTPLIIHRVPAGEYLVIVALDSGEFHEVFRTVPRPGQSPEFFRIRQWVEEAGQVVLPAIRIPRRDIVAGMVPFAGGRFTMGSADVRENPAHAETVEPFYLDSKEVSVAEYRAAAGSGQLHKWFDTAAPSHAVCWVNFDQAASVAEVIGKRLPDEFEYEFAATNGGKTRFPWGNERRVGDWKYGPGGSDPSERTLSKPHAYGLYSNVAEWTTSVLTLPKEGVPAAPGGATQKQPTRFPHGRVVRGGPFPVAGGTPAERAGTLEYEWEPRFRFAVARDHAYAGLGFRCARSQKPRFLSPQ